jgi:hypothetical protein
MLDNMWRLGGSGKEGQGAIKDLPCCSRWGGHGVGWWVLPYMLMQLYGHNQGWLGCGHGGMRVLGEPADTPICRRWVRRGVQPYNSAGRKL